MTWPARTLAWLILAPLAAAASPAPVPLLRVSCDASLLATGRVAAVAEEFGRSVSLTNGCTGRAMVAGSGGVQYRLDAAQQLPAGTILFWFRPLNWDDRSYIDLVYLRAFQGSSRQVVLRIYVTPHHWVGLSVLRYVEGAAVNFFANRAYVEGWRRHPDRWHLAAVTWEAGHAALYVDGLEVAADAAFKLDEQGFNGVQLGGESVAYPDGKTRELTDRHTLIDEFRLLDATLTREQLRQEFERRMGPLIDRDDF